MAPLMLVSVKEEYVAFEDLLERQMNRECLSPVFPVYFFYGPIHANTLQAGAIGVVFVYHEEGPSELARYVERGL